jgi:PEP-CTERM motif
MLFVLFSMWLLNVRSSAATITWFNSGGTELKDRSGTPLYEGPGVGSYNGDIIQLGFYTLATTANPFAGTWVALTNDTIGDKINNLPGRYNYNTNVSSGEILLGTPFVIRFYDSTTLETASFFNAVTDSTGGWNARNAPMTLSLLNSTLIWQDGKPSAFRTTIGIPEPSSLMLLGLGGWAAVNMRRRQGARFQQPRLAVPFRVARHGLASRHRLRRLARVMQSQRPQPVGIAILPLVRRQGT